MCSQNSVLLFLLLLIGIKNINTHDPAYLILGNFLKNIPEIKLDIAFGLCGLIWLYGVSYGCVYLANKYPRYANHLYLFSIMRNGILVCFIVVNPKST